jgi:hypothetical protein
MDASTAEFIPSNGKYYFAGGMPHGFSSPTFANSDVTAALESMIATLPEKRSKVRAYQFKSWATICDGFLEDVLTQAEGPVASVSVPVTSSVPI